DDAPVPPEQQPPDAQVDARPPVAQDAPTAPPEASLDAAPADDAPTADETPPDASVDDARVDATVPPDATPDVSVPDTAPPPIDAAPPGDADPTGCATGGPRGFLVSRDNGFFGFDPDTGASQRLGTLACPTAASPYVMTVTRARV